MGVADDVEGRIANLEARESILALKGRYWRAIDLGDADTVSSCLDENVVIDFEGMPRFEGAAAFVDVVRQASALPGSYHMHHGRNPQIAVTAPASAEGLWQVHYFGIDLPSRTLTRMSGSYVDRYSAHDGQWLISAMTMRRVTFVTEHVDADGVGRLAPLAERDAINSIPEKL